MLHGERVTLRPLGPADTEALGAMFALPLIAEAWPGDNIARLESHLSDDGVVGMVVEHGGQVIGFIQYYEEDDPNYRHAGIDVVLHPDWCDRGLGSDAVRTLARHLFDDLGHHRIMIDPRVTNLRAVASYRKVGFRDVGVMRRYERANDGTWHDALLMDLLRDELI
jgi:aminoglycoside 6'-N-acetyltransferase